jgi:hypothetical protein
MLAIATDRQNPEIVRPLVAHGADAKTKSKSGQTLERSAAHGSVPALPGLVWP